MFRTFAYAGAAISVAVFLTGCSTTREVTSQPEKGVVVSYGDLDLSRPADAQVLLRRVKSASRDVCGHEPDIRNLSRRAAYQRCVGQATDNAVTLINRPLVAGLYGKPQLVAEKHQVDASLVTSEIPVNAAIGQQTSAVTTARKN